MGEALIPITPNGFSVDDSLDPVLVNGRWRGCRPRTADVVMTAAPVPPILPPQEDMGPIEAVEGLTSLVFIVTAPVDLLVGPGVNRVLVTVVHLGIPAALVCVMAAPGLLRLRPAGPPGAEPGVAVEHYTRAAPVSVLAAPYLLLVGPGADRRVAVLRIILVDGIGTVGGRSNDHGRRSLNLTEGVVVVLAAPVLLVLVPFMHIRAIMAVVAALVLMIAAVRNLMLRPGVDAADGVAVVTALLVMLAAPGLLRR